MDLGRWLFMTIIYKVRVSELHRAIIVPKCFFAAGKWVFRLPPIDKVGEWLTFCHATIVYAPLLLLYDRVYYWCSKPLATLVAQRQSHVPGTRARADADELKDGRNAS